jgi:hypothetical protein
MQRFAVHVDVEYAMRGRDLVPDGGGNRRARDGAQRGWESEGFIMPGLA